MSLTLNQINSITKAYQIETLIDELLRKKLIKFRAVGDNECNCGIININTSPLSGFTERTINMIDSVLEKYYLTYSSNLSDEDLSSPRKFTEKVLKIPKGRMENLNDKKQIRKLAKDINITLQDSDEQKLPTVDFRDKGIGLLAKDMPKTILSLNHSRKINKKYLIGSFGQGGSTAFPCSKYTIIISRKFSTNNKLNKIAFTIVRYNDKDKENYKMGVYEYMVDKKTNLPLELDAPIEEFDSGTLVRHINMDINKYTSIPVTNPTNSLWFLTHMRLFDTVLPLWINDYRKSNTKGSKGRTVSGNFRRLYNSVENKDERGNSIVYSNSVNTSFYNDSIRITYWVVDFNNKNKPEKFTTNFIQYSHPIIITFNGQFHGELTNNIIKNDAELPYLDKLLIVHVNCDNISCNLRREMFSSTRESLKETDIQDTLRKTITFILSSDDTLRKLNRERRLSLTSSSTDSDIGSITEKIKEKLKKFLPNVPIGDNGPSVGHGNTDGTIDFLDPIPISDPPTFLKITSRTNSIINKKRKFSVKFKTDADPSLLNLESGRFSINVNPYNLCTLDDKLRISGGRGTIFFTISDKAKIDDIVEITITLELDNSSISDSVKFIVGQEFKSKPKKSYINKDIKLNSVKKDDPIWIEKEWTEESIAYFTEDTDTLDIHISMDNLNLKKILKTFNRFGIDTVKKIENYYIENIGYSILYYELINKEILNNMETDSSNTIRTNTYSTLNKIICSIIGDNKDIFKI